MTLEYSAREAMEKGSPVAIARPSPGAIGVYSPVAVVAGGDAEAAARSFVEWVLGVEAQQAIADTGWRPIRDDVTWDRSDGLVVPDWEQVFDRRDELLQTYAVVFGG